MQQIGRMATKCGIVSPIANRFYLFNYFEKTMDDEAFFKMWHGTATYLQDKEHFVSTHLHHATDSRTLYPWVNFAVFDSEDICVFGKPDPEWRRRMSEGEKANVKAFPGQYLEVASFNGNALNADSKQRPEAARFLLTGVVADESVTSEDLESNWTSWMGADFVRENLKDNPALGDTLLYRFTKGKYTRFRYTVRTEISQLSESEGQELAEACNKREHVKGVETFTGFYEIKSNVLSQAA